MRWEGYYPYPYLDAGGLPTIGFGHLVLPTDNIVHPLLGNDATNLLRQDVLKVENPLNKGLMLRKGVNVSQFDSLIDFSFNLGVHAFSHSTLRKKINQNASNDDITQEFLKWRYVGKKELKGLKLRRVAEAKLYVR